MRVGRALYFVLRLLHKSWVCRSGGGESHGNSSHEDRLLHEYAPRRSRGSAEAGAGTVELAISSIGYKVCLCIFQELIATELVAKAIWYALRQHTNSVGLEQSPASTHACSLNCS